VSLTRIVVLANSWKHQDWCLAGIDMATGKWVRPVTALNDGRIPQSDMKLDGYFPVLGDVLDIPLAESGPDFGFECENRTILPGSWRHCGKVKPANISKHATRPYYVLHNGIRYVDPKELQRKPIEKRTTLELIHVDKLGTKDDKKSSGDKSRWKGVIPCGGHQLDIRITDPVFCEKLDKGYKPAGPCVLTMSLSMPFKSNAHAEALCWKLIAGVIELES
jgi:hypothetical protein